MSLAQDLTDFTIDTVEVDDTAGAPSLESLAGGQAMTEAAASCSVCSCCVACCCCCYD